MLLPKLSDAQIAWIIERVAGYIVGQRQTYRLRAVPLDRNQKTTMQPFFPESTLDSARVVVLAPVCVRGEAYLAAHQGSEAAAEFQKILDQRGVVFQRTHRRTGPSRSRPRLHSLRRYCQSPRCLSGFLSAVERRRPRHSHP